MISSKGNEYEYMKYEGEDCVKIKIKGTNEDYVYVNRDSWDLYLHKYSWYGNKGAGARIDAMTTKDYVPKKIYKVIVELDSEYSELDSWGTTVDHKNNNPLDNRKSNLIPYSAPILNCTNISSKFTVTGMQYIQKQPRGGWKFHCNIAGKREYQHFNLKDHEGSDEKSLEAAKAYRDHWVKNERPKRIEAALKKTRRIEFERGLRDMINSNEHEDIQRILSKYHIETT